MFQEIALVLETSCASWYVTSFSFLFIHHARSQAFRVFFSIANVLRFLSGMHLYYFFPSHHARTFFHHSVTF